MLFALSLSIAFLGCSRSGPQREYGYPESDASTEVTEQAVESLHVGMTFADAAKHIAISSNSIARESGELFIYSVRVKGGRTARIIFRKPHYDETLEQCQILVPPYYY